MTYFWETVDTIAPGLGFGEYGDTHVRFGLVENEHRIRQAARNVKTFLGRASELLGNGPAPEFERAASK